MKKEFERYRMTGSHFFFILTTFLSKTLPWIHTWEGVKIKYPTVYSTLTLPDPQTFTSNNFCLFSVTPTFSTWSNVWYFTNYFVSENTCLHNTRVRMGKLQVIKELVMVSKLVIFSPVISNWNFDDKKYCQEHDND